MCQSPTTYHAVNLCHCKRKWQTWELSKYQVHIQVTDNNLLHNGICNNLSDTATRIVTQTNFHHSPTQSHSTLSLTAGQGRVILAKTSKVEDIKLFNGHILHLYTVHAHWMNSARCYYYSLQITWHRHLNKWTRKWRDASMCNHTACSGNTMKFPLLTSNRCMLLCAYDNWRPEVPLA